MRPPVKLPIAIDKYHTPMIKPPIRTGDSFVIALMPTGLNESSPKVWSRYVATSHHGLTFTPAAATIAAGTSSANPPPAHRRPTANFVGLDGSRDPRRIHSQANTGANVMMKSGCSDW